MCYLNSQFHSPHDCWEDAIPLAWGQKNANALSIHIIFFSYNISILLTKSHFPLFPSNIYVKANHVNVTRSTYHAQQTPSWGLGIMECGKNKFKKIYYLLRIHAKLRSQWTVQNYTSEHDKIKYLTRILKHLSYMVSTHYWMELLLFNP